MAKHCFVVVVVVVVVFCFFLFLFFFRNKFKFHFFSYRGGVIDISVAADTDYMLAMKKKKT